MEIGGINVRAHVIGAKQLLNGVDMVIGMDVLTKLGKISIANGKVGFAAVNTCAVASECNNDADKIEDRDFTAEFDGSKWTVKWKWKEGGQPVLKNQKEQYDSTVSEENKAAYESEVNRWIEEGILMPWKGEVGGLKVK